MAGEADEVPHDEEVGGEAHVADDPELEVEALHHLGRHRVAVTLLGPLVGQMAEIRLRPLLVGHAAEAVRHGELGQAGLAELNLYVGPLGDQQGVVARSGHVAKEVTHLSCRLEVVLGPLELESVGVAEQRAGLHAQESVVRHGVLSVGVVAVVGGEQRRTDALGDADQLRVGPVLVGEPVVLDLDEQVVASENVLQPGGALLGLHLVPGQQRLQHDTAQAPGGGDEAMVIPLEQLPVHPRLVVVTLEVGRRGQLHQVAVALDVLGQQGEVVVELLPALGVTASVVDPPSAHRTLVA